MQNISPLFSVSRHPLAAVLFVVLLSVACSHYWQPSPINTSNQAGSAGPVQLGVAERFKQSLGDAASRYVSQHIRQKLEDEALRTDLSDGQLIARFLDDGTPMAIRKVDAWRLARLGGHEARAALLLVLETGSSGLRAAVAEALGHSHWPDAGDILRELLTEQDPEVLRGGIAGLALIGDNNAVQSLSALLLNGNTEESIRAFIALRLGDVQTAPALAALIAATANTLSEDTLLGVATSLAKYPFAKTDGIFRGILANKQVSAAFKAEATEALAGADKKALPFLMDTASRYPDAGVRSSAAWAVGFHAGTGQLGQQLAKLVQQEPDDEVRRRLYEALMHQDAIPSQQLLDQALTEHDLAARIAAANMLAIALHQPSADVAVLQHRFDQEAVPDLLATALGDTNTNLRFRAVFALARADTAEATSALTTISRQGEPQIAGLANSSLARFSDTQKP